MPNIIIADKSYKLSELAAATTNADTDIFYVVKLVDSEEVAYKITRAQLLSGLGGTLSIENDGAPVGNASALNFVPGTNISFAIADAGSGQINVTVTASGSVAVAWGNITGTLADQTDLQGVLNTLASGIASNASDIATNAGNISTNAGDISNLQSTKYDASNPSAFITESQVTGTARQYTKGQGGTVTALSIATNETAIDFTDNNFFSLSLTDDTEIQLPTNDRPFSCAIFAAQDATGGRTLTFAAGYTVKGDTAPTTADDLFTIQITSNGAGRRIVTILDEQ